LEIKDVAHIQTKNEVIKLNQEMQVLKDKITGLEDENF